MVARVRVGPFIRRLLAPVAREHADRPRSRPVQQPREALDRGRARVAVGSVRFVPSPGFPAEITAHFGASFCTKESVEDVSLP